MIERSKKKVMMEYDGYCLKDLEVEHLPHSFRSCDISHYEDQASSLPPTAKTHGPMDTQNWSCMGKVALYIFIPGHPHLWAWRFHHHALETASIWLHDTNSLA
jgi:hypothetical protein